MTCHLSKICSCFFKKSFDKIGLLANHSTQRERGIVLFSQRYLSNHSIRLPFCANHSTQRERRIVLFSQHYLSNHSIQLPFCANHSTQRERGIVLFSQHYLSNPSQHFLLLCRFIIYVKNFLYSALISYASKHSKTRSHSPLQNINFLAPLVLSVLWSNSEIKCIEGPHNGDLL